jgi:hypothetical protein
MGTKKCECGHKVCDRCKKVVEAVDETGAKNRGVMSFEERVESLNKKFK